MEITVNVSIDLSKNTMAFLADLFTGAIRIPAKSTASLTQEDIDALRAVGVADTDIARSFADPTPAESPAAEPAEVITPEVVEPKKEPKKEITIAQLKVFCSERRNKDGINIPEILGKFGFKKMSDIHEDKIADVYEAVANA